MKLWLPISQAFNVHPTLEPVAHLCSKGAIRASMGNHDPLGQLRS